jgi:hypothetical protein
MGASRPHVQSSRRLGRFIVTCRRGDRSTQFAQANPSSGGLSYTPGTLRPAKQLQKYGVI